VNHLAKGKGWTREPAWLSCLLKAPDNEKGSRKPVRLKRQAELEADQARLALDATAGAGGRHCDCWLSNTSWRGKSDYLARKQVSAFGVSLHLRGLWCWSNLMNQLQRWRFVGRVMNIKRFL